MLRGTLGTIMATAVILNSAVAAYAQQPKPEPPPPTAQKAPNATPEKPAAKPPAVPDSATNVKIDLTITDQAGPGEPARRSVSMLVADQRTGSVRSSGQVTASRRSFQRRSQCRRAPENHARRLDPPRPYARVHAEARQRERQQRRRPRFAQSTAVGESRVGKADGDLSGVRSDIGPQDLGRS